MINDFANVINIVRSDNEDVFITIENRRSFRKLSLIKKKCEINDIVNPLEWFVTNSICLIVCNSPSAYEYGVSQPLNKAIISTILQSVLNSNKKVISISPSSNAGRSKIDFPDNWEELYAKWEAKEISSKQFIELSKFKKATFYNLITEYKELQIISENYMKKYKKA